MVLVVITPSNFNVMLSGAGGGDGTPPYFNVMMSGGGGGDVTPPNSSAKFQCDIVRWW